MAERTFSREIQLMAKRANQRLVEMSKRGIDSPSAESAKAYLASLGRRRFSETGKGTKRELQRQRRALEKFLGQQTSTVTGYKKYRRNVEKGLQERFPELGKIPGFTIENLLKLFKSLPGDKKDRLYSSDAYVTILEAYTRKNGQFTNESELTVEELLEKINSAGSFKEALKAAGLSFKDLQRKGIGAL